MSGRKYFIACRNYLFSAFLALALTACGGGSGGGDGGVAVATLSGTAATGAPLDGHVYVTDSNGLEVNAAINADGSFSVIVDGMTAPFLIRAIPSSGDTLYSYANATDITVNVTPLTNLAVFLAYNQGDLDALYSAWSSLSAQLTDFEILDAQETINANLSGIFATMGVDATSYDFLHTAFAANGSGIDGVMDGLLVSVDFTGGGFSITDSDLFALSFDVNVDTSGIHIDFSNGGALAIDPASTWQLTITDSANNIPPTTISVSGLEVPANVDAFNDFGQEDFAGTVVSDGLTIEFNISGVTYTVTGNGEPGTTIGGQMAGTVHISGVANGQSINETVTLNTLFEWERIQ